MVLTDERFAEGGGQGGHEKEDGHNEGAHILGGLGERIFKTSDGGENLADGDQDVTERDIFSSVLGCHREK